MQRWILSVLLALCTVLCGSSMVYAFCENQIFCLNSGRFNMDLCQCICLPNYVGTNCEILNCRHEDDACKQIQTGLCQTEVVRNHCVFTCGICRKTFFGFSNGF